MTLGYKAPTYSKEDLYALDESQIKFPFNDDDATYNGLYHQYELTAKYFEERGHNLQVEIDGSDAEKVKHFLSYLRTKVYNYVYTHSQSTRAQLNYMIAKRGVCGFTPYEYRQSFLEAMYLEGCYLINNGDISQVTGIDLDTMQNMSADVMRNQDRDMNVDCLRLLKKLGLNYFGRYRFIPQGKEW